MIPEDRKQHGLLLPHSIRSNTTLGHLVQLTRPRWWISKARERPAAETHLDALAVHRRSLEQPAEQLSGGNQQKVVMARWLMRSADVLLFDEPTRGIYRLCR